MFPPSLATPKTVPRPFPAPAAIQAGGVPFPSAEEAWFWFIQAQEAKAAGARVRAGLGLTERPCEPLDIYRTVDRLYRQRKLLRDHLHVMAHYGRRLSAPDSSRDREARAAVLWAEAFDQLTPLLRQKGIVQ